MAYPKELLENTRLTDKLYPINMFVNGRKPVSQGQNILYLHWHEHIELIVMKEGAAEFLIDSCSYKVKPGDVLFVPSGSLHVGYSLNDQTVTYISIVFNASLLADSLQDPVFAQYVKPIMESGIRTPILLDERASEQTQASVWLDHSIEEFESKRPAYQLVVKSCMLLVLTTLARRHAPDKGAERSSGSLSFNRDRFKPLLQRLETQVAAKMTLEQAARTVSLNVFHFCKLFKKLTGRSFVDYANMCRMREADRLLRETSLSVTEVADRVGCGNPNYFTKVFKQFMGKTPTEARKK